MSFHEVVEWVGFFFLVSSVLCVIFLVERHRRLTEEQRLSEAAREYDPILVGLGYAGLVTWCITAFLGGMYLLRAIFTTRALYPYLVALAAVWAAVLAWAAWKTRRARVAKA